MPATQRTASRRISKPAPTPPPQSGDEEEAVASEGLEAEDEQPSSSHGQGPKYSGDGGAAGEASGMDQDEPSDYGDDGDEELLSGGSGSELLDGDPSDQELDDDEFAGMDDEFADAGYTGLGLREQGDEDADDEDADDEDEGDEGKKPRSSRVPYKFLEGDKSASFAKAFAKIVERKLKAAPAAKDAEATASKDPVADILVESKDVAKRKAEELEAAKANRLAKRLKLEMRRRGHAKVLRKGQDPTADQKEKSLVSLATRGVVLLFNAVAKAQKTQQEAGGVKGSKAVKLNKAAFLSQLKGAAAAADGAKGKGGVLGLGAGGAQGSQDAPGWRVLQQDFTGVQGSSKMRDWDKEQSDSDGGAPEKIEVESDDDNGW